ncbi:unnamed protein product [Linum tenue]|uniref:Uncharacterized protein n=1 Tax=Linum tenue TaxID=586396 RepID=A0AAV0L7T4_9ROSI|nr:unnamed protein product [Linum tenue]
MMAVVGSHQPQSPAKPQSKVVGVIYGSSIISAIPIPEVQAIIKMNGSCTLRLNGHRSTEHPLRHSSKSSPTFAIISSRPSHSPVQNCRLDDVVTDVESRSRHRHQSSSRGFTAASRSPPPIIVGQIRGVESQTRRPSQKMDAGSGFPSLIRLYPEEESDFEASVAYSHMPPICSKCEMFGHNCNNNRYDVVHQTGSSLHQAPITDQNEIAADDKEFSPVKKKGRGGGKGGGGGRGVFEFRAGLKSSVLFTFGLISDDGKVWEECCSGHRVPREMLEMGIKCLWIL